MATINAIGSIWPSLLTVNQPSVRENAQQRPLKTISLDVDPAKALAEPPQKKPVPTNDKPDTDVARSGSASEKGHFAHEGRPTYYDYCHLKKGFTENISAADQLKLSPVGQRLSRMLATQEVLSTEEFIKKTFYGEGADYDFTAAFRETRSADGGLVVRQFNRKALEHVRSLEDVLVLYEQAKQKVDGAMVMLDGISEIGFKMFQMFQDEHADVVENSINHTLDLHDRYNEFTTLLGETDPTLAGVRFEFELDGDRLKVTGGKVDDRNLTEQDMAFIENLANSRDLAGKRLVESMMALREDALVSYNKFSAEGRANPIAAEEFGERFGGFSRYLDMFKSDPRNAKFDLKSPDDIALNSGVNIDRSSYFDTASKMLATRLTISA